MKDIKVGQDNVGKYIDFTGNTAKNNQGGLSTIIHNRETKSLRYYSQNGDHNNVDIYSEYIDSISKVSTDDNGPFYHRPLPNLMHSIRFSKQPMGINYLTKIIRSIASRAELQGRFTGHNGKATGITQMYDDGVSENTIQQGSRNRSLDSLRKYSRSRTSKATLAASKALAPGDIVGLRTQVEESNEKISSANSQEINLACTEDNQIITIPAKKIMTIEAKDNSAEDDLTVAIPTKKRMVIEANGDSNIIKFTFV